LTNIYIENRSYEVKEGDNLLHACLNLGFNIPYFCWHPAMHSVGSCRLCAVKQFRDEKDTRGRIVMSCMTPVKDGMRISIDDEEVKTFRAGIIEMLMLNHPHDCPVCDEGGECHLQDMTLMTGHIYRRSRFKKRTYRNQYIGPFLNHEMNRCIHCYRCVRFYCDHAGGRDLGAFASQRVVYFGRHEDGVLENVFSGNLAEICPTGVFTDKTFKRHYTRKWDLQTAPSVCVHCGLGCNTLPGERYGTLRRIRNRYNGEVNGYYLCDRGRFGYEFVNHELRVRMPVLKKTAPHLPVSGDEKISNEKALEYLSHLLHFGAKVIGIGSPRASLEANYALRTLVGPENFYSGMSEREAGLIDTIIEILRSGPARTPSLRDAAGSDTVFILGEDVMNTAPMLGFSIRQSVSNKPVEAAREMGIHEWDDAAMRIVRQNERAPLYIAATGQTGLDDIAETTYRAAPDDLARLGFAVAHLLDKDSPPVPDLSDDLKQLAQTIAEALKNARRPLIVSGTGCGNESLIHAAANVARALCSIGLPASLCYAVPECNSLGLGLMGGSSIRQAFERAKSGDMETVIILENDLYRRADAESVDSFLGSIPNVVVIDHLNTRTALRGHAVLPSGTFAETGGTLVSNEGRAQRFFKVFTPAGPVEENWRWLCSLLSVSERAGGKTWKTTHDITAAMAEEMNFFSPAVEEGPPPEYRVRGQKIPRQPHRFSGRTSMNADKTIHEPKPPDDTDSALSFSMEGYEGTPPSSLLARYWFPAWNSVQSLNKFQDEIGGSLRGGDPGKRLIEPSATEKISYFNNIPRAFTAQDSKWLFIPLHHIFGSEELSILAPGVAELCPQPYVSLNSHDAARLGAEEGSEATISIKKRTFTLTVRIDQAIPSGLAGLPSLDGIIPPVMGGMSLGGGKQ